MTSRVSSGEVHDRVWELLPWVVNGRLAQDDEDWVARHIEECADCRSEVQAQERLQSVLVNDARVEYAPSASFQKLATRIEELERQMPDASPAERVRVARPRAPSPRLPRWLLAALAGQGAVVVALAVLVAWQNMDRMMAPRFQTLTSEANPAAIRGNLRVVLAPSVSVAELRKLMGSVNAQIVAGPTDAGVWTLAVPYAASSADFSSAVERLRADGRVAFAEPVADSAAGPTADWPASAQARAPDRAAVLSAAGRVEPGRPKPADPRSCRIRGHHPAARGSGQAVRR